MVEIGDYIGDISLVLNLDLVLKVVTLIIILAAVSLFIWEFYKSISRRNLIKLNLSEYNKSEHPVSEKFFAVVLYLIEYVIVMPFLIVLWFAALSAVLLLIAEKGTQVNQILLIAAIVVGASRVLAYLKGEISKDLAKLFPFIALSIYVLTLGNLFNVDEFLGKIKEIPLLFNDIFSYIVAILIVEVALRFIFTLIDLTRSEEKEVYGY